MQVNLFQMKMDQDTVSKFAKTQSIIKNKFTVAHANRLECEHNVNQAMQPLVRTTVKHIDTKNDECKSVDLNVLCNRLRLLLSTQNASKVDHSEEINTIISKLRDLKILI